MSKLNPAVVHNRAAARFEADFAGRLCLADYRIEGGVLTMTHTYVPPPLEGHGIAAALVEQALAYARREGLRVRPSCSYVARYMRRHPDTLDLLADTAR
jgi:predicted GNAT family acetyltransferase